MNSFKGFTFIDRIEEIEKNIEDKRWQSALALSLTLPDILGGIAFPELVKRYKDGKVKMDGRNNPTRDVGAQYMKWFDEYAADFFKANESDKWPYICGRRCYQLRCEFLHQNKGFHNEDVTIDTHFHLGLNCGTSLCNLDDGSSDGDIFHIRIDIEQFCIRMCRAARAYYENFHEQKEFDLYNTPVIDFLEWNLEKAEKKAEEEAKEDKKAGFFGFFKKK
ncbi:MAG: hypothetical protein E7225_06485 [Clostridiales bacterium]|nr:hypothetical protein [Clostridiales bacterium]